MINSRSEWQPVITLQVVLAPVMLGAVLNQKAPRAVARVAPFMPLVAVSMVTLVCSSVIAQNAAAVRGAGFSLLTAIVALHAGEWAGSQVSMHALTALGACCRHKCERQEACNTFWGTGKVLIPEIVSHHD